MSDNIYTHRIALSNERLVKLEGNQVTFRMSGILLTITRYS
ncbi:MAG TPA: hypothetical protein DD719_08230 [Desulfotomaculum sp.]|nr:hypothetical protein [Desulfotomaculum sp.]